MTIQTDTNNINYVAIQPLVINTLSNQIATRVYVCSVNDNLSTSCTFSCTLQDESGNNLYNTQIVMFGSDYSSWTGDNVTPFSFCISKITQITTL